MMMDLGAFWETILQVNFRKHSIMLLTGPSTNRRRGNTEASNLHAAS